MDAVDLDKTDAEWRSLLTNTNSLISQIPPSHAEVQSRSFYESSYLVSTNAGVGDRKNKAGESKAVEDKKIIPELYSLLGKHDIDTFKLEKSLTKLAKADVVDTDQRSLVKHKEEESRGLQEIEKKYSSPLETVLGGAVDLVLKQGNALSRKELAAHLESSTHQQIMEALDLISESVTTLQLEAPKQTGNTLMLQMYPGGQPRGTGSKNAVGSTLPLSDDVKANLLYSILEKSVLKAEERFQDRYSRSLSFTRSHAEGLQELGKLKSLTLWTLLTKLAEAQHKKAGQSGSTDLNALNSSDMTLETKILTLEREVETLAAYQTSTFLKSSSLTDLDIARIGRQHLEGEYYLFMSPKQVPELYAVDSQKNRILEYLKQVKTRYKNGQRVGGADSWLSQSLFEYSEHLTGAREGVDRKLKLNVYAIMFYFLRCGYEEDLLDYVERWMSDGSLPAEEHFLYDVLKRIVREHEAGVKSEHRRLAGQLATRAVEESGSPWKIAVLELIEGIPSEATKAGSLFETIQDYLWRQLFILSNRCTDTMTLKDVGKMILSCGADYFAAERNPYLYGTLLVLCGEFAEAVAHLSMTAANKKDVGLQAEALHLAICLKQCKLLSCHRSDIFDLHQNRVGSFSARSLIQIAEDKKTLALGKLVHLYSSHFLKTNITACLCYVSQVYDAEDSESVKETLSMLKHLIVETLRVDILIDGTVQEDQKLPRLYELYKHQREQPALAVSDVSNVIVKDIQSIRRHEGLLFKLNIFSNEKEGVQFCKRVIQEAARLAEKNGDSLLSFSMFLRTLEGETIHYAVTRILVDTVWAKISADGTAQETIPWKQLLSELVVSDSLKSVLLPETQRTMEVVLSLLMFMEELAATKKLKQVDTVDTYSRAARLVKICLPSNRNQVPHCVATCSVLPVKLQKAVYVVLLNLIERVLRLLSTMKVYTGIAQSQGKGALQEMLAAYQLFYTEARIPEPNVAQALASAQYATS